MILVSNDDGYQAGGVHRLTEWLAQFGDVVAVCPDGPRSAQSMAITINNALFVTPLGHDGAAEWYKVNGTPVDCVKLAMHEVLRGRRPDLVVAGINHGSNASVNECYSGTMGAVFEGCAFGIPAIGFSLTDHAPDADFNGCRPFVEKIAEATLREGLPEGVCLNVNIPAVKPYPTEMRTVRSCRGKWSDEYKAYRDPHGRPFYWITGEFVNLEPENEQTDEWCLAHGIVTVVPTTVTRTAPEAFTPLWLRDLH